MTTLVVDASVAIKWVAVEADSKAALMVLSRCTLIAPELMIAEVANILWAKVRAKEFSLSEAQEAAGLIREAGIGMRPMSGLLNDAIGLAAKLEHPAYDCIYLALAMSAGVRFITADARFQRKLVASGDEQLAQTCVLLSDWRDDR